MSFNRSAAASQRRLVVGLVAATAALLPLGCGHAGPPHPPLRALPAAATDLAVRQRGNTVMIDLAYPQTTAAGKSLAGISALEIWEAARPVATTPPETPDALDPRLYTTQAKRKQRLATATDIGAATEGPRIELVVDLPKSPLPNNPPDAHFFTVKTVGVQNDASGFSNQGVVVPKDPPDPPTSLTVSPRADGVLVQWEPAPAKPAPPPTPPTPAATTKSKGKTESKPVSPKSSPSTSSSMTSATPATLAAPVAPAAAAATTPPASAGAPSATPTTPTTPATPMATPAPSGPPGASGPVAASAGPTSTTGAAVPVAAGSASTATKPGATPLAAAPAPPHEPPPPPPNAGGYYIYRRGTLEKRYPFKPLAVVRKRSHEFLDATAAFGQTYVYTVTQIDERDLQVESAIGKEQDIQYVDKYPPPVPRELLVVVESATRLHLLWRPSEAPDLAGYLVYRLTGDEGWKKLTDKPVASPSYIDTTTTAGKSYQYRVTAIDMAGNESEPTDIVRLSTPTG
jgi:hypothetical protein